MCVVCVLWDKKKIQPKEGKKALLELARSSTNKDDLRHMQELYTELQNAHDEQRIRLIERKRKEAATK